MAVMPPLDGSNLELEENLKSSLSGWLFDPQCDFTSYSYYFFYFPEISTLQTVTDTLNQQRFQENIYYSRLISLS